MSRTDESFSVAVEEAQGRRQFGASQPQGVYILFPGSDREERVSIPQAVARRLKRLIETERRSPRTHDEAVQLVSETMTSCAIKRLEALLNRRDYAVAEIRAKLIKDGYDSAIVASVLDRAVAGHALDDARFADVYIRSKLSCGWGCQRIERGLAERGIEAQSVPGWPYDYVDVAAEADRAYELASRRRLTGKNDYAKLVRFLLSRGFLMKEAQEASRRVLAGACSDER